MAPPSSSNRSGILRTAATARRSTLPAPSEHASQAAFFAWWVLYAPTVGVPERLCFAVPNGGKRHIAVAAKLKAEGARAGVVDVFLDVPAAGFHGLRLEFKKPGKKVRPGSEQEAWIFDARRMGYNVLVVWTTEEAIRAVKAYISGWKAPEQQPPTAIRLTEPIGKRSIAP